MRERKMRAIEEQLVGHGVKHVALLFPIYKLVDIERDEGYTERRCSANE